MKVLIIGAKGMLGQELAKSFAKLEPVLWDKEDLDITDEKMVNEKLQLLKPDLVINAAAYNAVDDIEKDEFFAIAQKVNYEGPLNLAKATQKIGAYLVHYSTDYVFDGEKKEGYHEHDLPSPVSRYGESKFLSEEVLEYNPDTFIIRTSRLFGLPAQNEQAKKSFVEIMLELADKKEELEIVDEEVSSPTYVLDLAEATKDLVTENYHPGIYHITNQGSCTWFEFALEIFTQARKTINVVPVPSSKFPRPAKRPAFSVLKNNKIPPLQTWQKGLQDFLLELQEAGKLVIPEEINEPEDVVEQVEKLPFVEEPVKDQIEPKIEVKKIPIPVPEIRKVKENLIEPIFQLTKKEVPQSNESVQPVKQNIKTGKKEMKGIILSGGRGTRLYPLTKITSKQLLPVYNKPMIMYPLQTLISAGIKDILVIIAPDYAGQYLNLLGSGKEWGVKIRYEIQDEPKGLPDAFIIGENFIGQDNVTMILGDNLFFDHNFAEDIKTFESGGRIFALEVPDPQRFGIVEFDQDMNVLSIEEKPQKPKSNYAIPGVYIFDNRVCEIAKNVKPTWRDETDITEVHKAYLQMGELDVRKVYGRWLDAGTHQSLLKASNLAATLEYQKKMGYNESALNNN